MPKAIKKRIVKSKTIKEEKVKSTALQALDALKQRQKHAIIAASAVIGIVILYIVFSLYSSSMAKKAYALETEAYDLYYSEITDESISGAVKWQKAIDLFKKSLDAKATPTAAFYLGNCYFNMADYETAIKEYTSFINKFSQETGILPLVYQKLSSSFFKTGQNEKALETLGKLAKIENGIFGDSALILEARHFAASGEKEKAMGKYRELIINFPASMWTAEANSKVTADETAKSKETAKPKEAAPVITELPGEKTENPAAVEKQKD
jgi:tetratricopeptide (TPR) repeat protein